MVKQKRGLLFAVAILVAWLSHMVFALATVSLESAGALTVLRAVGHVLLQGYLYTGLFITAHDAMHGTVHPRRKVNRIVGTVTAFLFAAVSYRRLIKNHMKHHRWPGTDRDPDYSVRSQNFLLWLGSFFLHYVTVVQIAIMAAIFNLLILVFPTYNVVLFWMIPAFLGTVQLFYFGTYRPHMQPHTDEMLPHNARSQRHNHVLAMLSCYFFGYHHEHHDSPGTPWWRLHKIKDEGVRRPDEAS